MRASIEAERESVVKDVRLRRLSTGGWCIVNGLMMRKIGRAARFPCNGGFQHAQFTGKAKAHA